MRASYLTAILSLPFLLASCADNFVGEVNLVLGGVKTPIAGGHCEKYIEIPQPVKDDILERKANDAPTPDIDAWLLWLHEDVRARLTGGCPKTSE